MDVLIAIGTSVAFLYSLVVVFLPGRLPSATYFDASALIITLILDRELPRAPHPGPSRPRPRPPRGTPSPSDPGDALGGPPFDSFERGPGGDRNASRRAADSRRMRSSDPTTTSVDESPPDGRVASG